VVLAGGVSLFLRGMLEREDTLGVVLHRVSTLSSGWGCKHKRENYLCLCDAPGDFGPGCFVKRQQGYRVKRISACGGCLGNDRR
jgi:hypothetical protein